MTTVHVMVPVGALGSEAGEHPLVSMMRVIGLAFGDEGDWCSKYGVNFENDVFAMRRYSWAGCSCGAHDEDVERDHDPDCELEIPNFRYKPSGFEMRWYKYIGRDTEVRGELPSDFLDKIFATHTGGMTVEDAIRALEHDEREQQDALREMLSDLNGGAKQ